MSSLVSFLMFLLLSVLVQSINVHSLKSSNEKFNAVKVRAMLLKCFRAEEMPKVNSSYVPSIMQSKIRNCRKRLVVSIRFNVRKGKIGDKFIVLKHVYDVRLQRRSPLLSPLVIRLTQDKIHEIYGLHFIQRMKSKVNEEGIYKNSKNFSGCVTKSTKPTYGVSFSRDKIIPLSQGLCYSCNPYINAKRQLKPIMRSENFIMQYGKSARKRKDRAIVRLPKIVKSEKINEDEFIKRENEDFIAKQLWGDLYDSSFKETKSNKVLHSMNNSNFNALNNFRDVSTEMVGMIYNIKDSLLTSCLKGSMSSDYDVHCSNLKVNLASNPVVSDSSIRDTRKYWLFESKDKLHIIKKRSSNKLNVTSFPRTGEKYCDINSAVAEKVEDGIKNYNMLSGLPDSNDRCYQNGRSSQQYKTKSNDKDSKPDNLLMNSLVNGSETILKRQKHLNDTIDGRNIYVNVSGYEVLSEKLNPRNLLKENTSTEHVTMVPKSETVGFKSDYTVHNLSFDKSLLTDKLYLHDFKNNLGKFICNKLNLSIHNNRNDKNSSEVHSIFLSNLEKNGSNNFALVSDFLLLLIGSLMKQNPTIYNKNGISMDRLSVDSNVLPTFKKEIDKHMKALIESFLAEPNSCVMLDKNNQNFNNCSDINRCPITIKMEETVKKGDSEPVHVKYVDNNERNEPLSELKKKLNLAPMIEKLIGNTNDLNQVLSLKVPCNVSGNASDAIFSNEIVKTLQILNKMVFVKRFNLGLILNTLIQNQNDSTQSSSSFHNITKPNNNVVQDSTNMTKHFLQRSLKSRNNFINDMRGENEFYDISKTNMYRPTSNKVSLKNRSSRCVRVGCGIDMKPNVLEDISNLSTSQYSYFAQGLMLKNIHQLSTESYSELEDFKFPRMLHSYPNNELFRFQNYNNNRFLTRNIRSDNNSTKEEKIGGIEDMNKNVGSTEVHVVHQNRRKNYKPVGKRKSRSVVFNNNVLIRGRQSWLGQDIQRHLNPKIFHKSVNCLRLNDLWYSVYKLGKPTMEHSVHLKIQEKYSNPDGKLISWSDLTGGVDATIGPFRKKLVDKKNRFSATYFYIQDRPFSLNYEHLNLLIPQRVDGVNHPAVKGGPRQYLLVNDHELTICGNKCDKADNNLNGVSQQPNRCYRPHGSYLNNQPADMWRHDMVAKRKKKPGKYFLENFASIPLHPLMVDRSSFQEYLSLNYMGRLNVGIDLELKADSNAVVRSGSLGQIIEIFVDATCDLKLKILINAMNLDLASSSYYLKITNCSKEMNEIWIDNGPLKVIPPQHSYMYRLSISGPLPIDNIYCFMELTNEKNHVVARRQFLVKRKNRCLCVWHCLCTCFGVQPDLKCKPIADKSYHDAGFEGSLPITTVSKRKAYNSNSWPAYFHNVLIIYSLTFLNIISLGINLI